MKKKTLFLLAPLALAALASCGGSTSWSKITYKKATEKAAEFSENLGKYNKKASHVNITGTVSNFSFKGDARIRNNTMDVDTKNASIQMHNQELVKTSVDLNSIRTMIDDNLSEVLYYFAFPINKHTVKFANGVNKLPLAYYYDKTFNWDTVADGDWANIDTTFYAGDGKLKINFKSDKVVAAIDEINNCLSNPKAGFSSDTDIRASISLSTNKWGYVESLSVNVKAPAIEYEELDDYPDVVIIDGSLNFSATFNFDYEYVETRTIQYQVGEYDATTGALKKTSKIASVDDDEIKKYFTGEWYNYNNPNFYSGTSDVDSYDDPLFNLYYWIKRSRSIAYTGEGYSLNLIPVCDAITQEQQDYKPHYDFIEENCYITIDGKKLEDPLGLETMYIGTKDYPNYPYKVTWQDNPVYIDALGVGAVYLNADIISSLAKDSKVVVYVAVKPHTN